jgi:DnaJ-class molecular chaperone
VWLGLGLVVILIGVGYYYSLQLNPWVVCRKCHGTPRLKGLVFKHAQRICPRCGGSGQTLRLGRRLFGMGRPR